MIECEIRCLNYSQCSFVVRPKALKLVHAQARVEMLPHGVTGASEFGSAKLLADHNSLVWQHVRMR